MKTIVLALLLGIVSRRCLNLFRFERPSPPPSPAISGNATRPIDRDERDSPPTARRRVPSRRFVVTVIAMALIAIWILLSIGLIRGGDTLGGVAALMAVPGIAVSLLLVLSSGQCLLLRWIVRVAFLGIATVLFWRLACVAAHTNGPGHELVTPSIAVAAWASVFIACIGDILTDIFPRSAK